MVNSVLSLIPFLGFSMKVDIDTVTVTLISVTCYVTSVICRMCGF